MGKKKPDTVYSAGDEDGPESPFAALAGLFSGETDDAVSPRPHDPAHAGQRPAAGKAPGARPSPNAGAQVRVHRERKGRGGKTVSVITGLPGPNDRRKVLLKQLKNRLGTGGSVENDTLVIQGDLRERIVEILNEMGYRAKSAGG